MVNVSTSHFSETASDATIVTGTSEFKMIGQGPAGDTTAFLEVHVTMDANGEVTADTFHAHGNLAWNAIGKPVWGFLMDRIDHRIAVTEAARESAARWFPGEYELIPNGVLIPAEADPARREKRVVFVGRHDPRKGMPVLLRAWPEIHRRTGARLRIVGADPLMVRLALTRLERPSAGSRARTMRPSRR